MARLVDIRTGPPGGWRYVQPETGAELFAFSFPELLERVIDHRRYKKVGTLDPNELAAEVERQICSGLEPRFCLAEPGEDFRPIPDHPGGLTVSKVTSASIAFVAFVKGEAAIVEKAESEARAATCRGCRFNRNPDGCGACSALFALLGVAIPKGRAEPGLKACGACGCDLKLKVLMPAAVIEASNKGRGVEYPEHCWQRAK